MPHDHDKMLTAIGMMSGTSMDGIDIAALRTDGANKVEVLGAYEAPYSSAFRQELIDACSDSVALADKDAILNRYSALAYDIAERHADALDKALAAMALERSDINLIGFHGQTVLHRPDLGWTVQLGDGQALANLSRLPVVFDLRTNDMRHGGQGAPLIPAYHRALFEKNDLEGPVMFVNIGGISNITWVNHDCDPVAFDAGPGNGLIDQWVLAQAGIPYDDGGRIASEGLPDMSRIEAVLTQPFFDKAGAKSLDRADFSPDIVSGLELSDGAATLASLTAHAIFKAAEHVPEPPRQWIICGGGRKNLSILRALERLADSHSQSVVPAENVGLNGDTMEAEGWAYLAVRAYNEQPITWPTTTGCNAPVSGGQIFIPSQ